MTWAPANPKDYLERWRLRPLTAPITTASSILIPVEHPSGKAMLKVARVEEEARGCQVLAWWNGHGAAPVWEADEHAAVIAWADGSGTLRTLSVAGDDDAATSILCGLAAELHDASAVMTPPAGLVELRDWFSLLFARAERLPHEYGGRLLRATHIAEELLADTSQDVVLHGDLHHDNVLDFGGLGWRAIDPKGLRGNRLFDYTTLLCNPTPEIAEQAFDRRIDLVATAAFVTRTELLRWTLAWTALSACWFAADGSAADVERILRISALAEHALDRG